MNIKTCLSITAMLSFLMSIPCSGSSGTGTRYNYPNDEYFTLNIHNPNLPKYILPDDIHNKTFIGNIPEDYDLNRNTSNENSDYIIDNTISDVLRTSNSSPNMLPSSTVVSLPYNSYNNGSMYNPYSNTSLNKIPLNLYDRQYNANWYTQNNDLNAFVIRLSNQLNYFIDHVHNRLNNILVQLGQKRN